MLDKLSNKFSKQRKRWVCYNNICLFQKIYAFGTVKISVTVKQSQAVFLVF